MICRYYEGQLTDLSEVDAEEEEKKERGKVTEATKNVSLQEEQIKPHSDLPPLLVGLHE